MQYTSFKNYLQLNSQFKDWVQALLFSLLLHSFSISSL